MTKITIAIVYKTGGDYDETYVERLVAGVGRNIASSYEVVCLSDGDPLYLKRRCGVDGVVPLASGWPGWWSKMELFRLHGPVLYFDLDTIIVGSIDPLIETVLECDDDLIMLRGFYRDDRCSGILGWRGDVSVILDAFSSDANAATFRVRPTAINMLAGRHRYRGDQEWLRMFLKKRADLSVVMLQDRVDGIVSFKVNVQGGKGVFDDARVVCFHGEPRPHNVRPVPEWMERHWSEATR